MGFGVRSVWLFLTFLLCLLPLQVRAEGEVRAILFSSEGCDHCRAVWEEVIPPLQASFPLEVRRLEISNPENDRLMTSFQRARGLAEGEVPLVILGEQALQGEEAIRAELLGAVLELATRGGSDWPTPSAGALDALPVPVTLPPTGACGPGQTAGDTCKPSPERR